MYCQILGSVLSLGIILCLHGCYGECMQDSDCGSGGTLTCSKDHLCIEGTESDELCQEVYPPEATPDAVPVGALLHLSGQSPQVEINRSKILRMIIDDMNYAARTPWTQPFVLHICNVTHSTLSRDKIVTDTQKAAAILLKDRKVVAVIGPGTSDEVYDAFKLSKTFEVPFLSPSATATALSYLPPNLIFRMMPPNQDYVPYLSSILPTTKNMAIVYTREAFGIDLYSSLLMRLPLPSTDIFVRNFLHVEGDTERNNAATDVVVAAPELVVLLVNSDTVGLLHALVGLRLDAKIYITNNAKNLDLLKKIKAQLSMLTGTARQDYVKHISRILISGPTVDENAYEYRYFSTQAKANTGVDPSTDFAAAFAHDALYAIALGVIGGNPIEPLPNTRLSRFLRGLQTGSPIALSTSNYQKSLDMLRQNSNNMPVTLIGASGEISFSSTQARTSGVYTKWRVVLDMNAEPHFEEEF